MHLGPDPQQVSKTALRGLMFILHIARRRHLYSTTAAPSAGLARGLPSGPSKAELLGQCVRRPSVQCNTRMLSVHILMLLRRTIIISEKTRKKKDDGESPEERKARLAQERKERLERQKQIEVGKTAFIFDGFV